MRGNDPSGQLPCFLGFLRRLRRDRRVTVSMMASASAMSPATWPVSPGLPNPRAEESDTGLAFRLSPSGWIPGDELGVADGLIAGNKRDALPGPMIELETPLRFGSARAAASSPAMSRLPTTRPARPTLRR